MHDPKLPSARDQWPDPIESMASVRHVFGEHGGVNMSVETSTTFTVLDPDTMPALFKGEKSVRDGCFLYGRHFNPTVYGLAQQLAVLEGAQAAYCTASGMAAISAVLLQLCNHGEHIVASNTVYGGTHALLNDFLPVKSNITAAFVDINDVASVEAAITRDTRVIFAESIANPTLRVANIPALAALAKRHGIKLVIDNTFSPLLLQPIHLGADVVVHSLTKFINGASDIVGGVVCGDADLVCGLMDLHLGPLMILGPTMDPTIASQIGLRLPHLPLRMAEHSRRAMIFATHLEAMGQDVIYPGLAAHPDHGLIKGLHVESYGFGGILTLKLPSSECAQQLMKVLQNKFQFGFMAVSLGYFDTLMSCPALSTSSELSPQQMTNAGIEQGLLRMSIGYTGSVEQRWNQFRDAMEHVGIC